LHVPAAAVETPTKFSHSSSILKYIDLCSQKLEQNMQFEFLLFHTIIALPFRQFGLYAYGKIERTRNMIAGISTAAEYICVYIRFIFIKTTNDPVKRH